MPKIGINGSSPCCLRCGRFRKPPLGFPHSSSSMVVSPGGCLMSLGRLGRRDLQTAVVKFSMSWTSEQISTHKGGSLWRICCQAVKTKPLALVSGGDHLLLQQLTDLAKLQADFVDVFSPRSGRTDRIQHHIETLPGGCCTQPALSVTRIQEKSGSGGIKGHARVGGNRRIA